MSGGVRLPLPPYPFPYWRLSPQRSVWHVILPLQNLALHCCWKNELIEGLVEVGPSNPFAYLSGLNWEKSIFWQNWIYSFNQTPQNRQTHIMETPCKEGGSTVEESVVFLLCPNDSFSLIKCVCIIRWHSNNPPLHDGQTTCSLDTYTYVSEIQLQSCTAIWQTKLTFWCIKKKGKKKVKGEREWQYLCVLYLSFGSYLLSAWPFRVFFWTSAWAAITGPISRQNLSRYFTE